MPPTRRHTRTTTPPTRRPRVAGLRRPGTAPAKPAPEQVEPAELESPETPELDTPEPETAEVESPEVEEQEPTGEHVSSVVVDNVIGAPAPEKGVDEQPAPDGKPARSRPSGKHRWTGKARPDDLAEAEADLAGEEPVRTKRDGTVGWAIAIGVVAVILALLAVWFRGEANSRSEGADVNNKALTDPATQSEVVRQMRAAVEKAFTYNYTDLDSTAKAVQENLSGKALCEYELLYGQVKKLAPEQKLVLTTQVREIGVTRLESDRAALLVFVDQRTTRADQNQTTASGAQFGIDAERQNGTWKITNIDMLGQPLPNGQPAPQC